MNAPTDGANESSDTPSGPPSAGTPREGSPSDAPRADGSARRRRRRRGRRGKGQGPARSSTSPAADAGSAVNADPAATAATATSDGDNAGAQSSARQPRKRKRRRGGRAAAAARARAAETARTANTPHAAAQPTDALDTPYADSDAEATSRAASKAATGGASGTATPSASRDASRKSSRRRRGSRKGKQAAGTTKAAPLAAAAEATPPASELGANKTDEQARAEALAARRARAERETSAGGIVYRVHDGEALFLLIRDSYRNWGFPKGHLEAGELPDEAAIREVQEETGLSELQLDGAIETIDWFFRFRGKLVHKVCHFYLMRTENTRTVPQREEGITACRWARFEDATRLISYANARAVLTRANDMVVASALAVSAASGGAPAPASTAVTSVTTSPNDMRRRAHE